MTRYIDRYYLNGELYGIKYDTPAPVQHTVTFYDDGLGTVNINEIVVDDGTVASVSGDTIVIGDTTIVANPEAGYEFNCWEYNGTQTDPTEDITISSDSAFTANFNLIPFEPLNSINIIQSQQGSGGDRSNNPTTVQFFARGDGNDTNYVECTLDNGQLTNVSYYGTASDPLCQDMFEDSDILGYLSTALNNLSGQYYQFDNNIRGSIGNYYQGLLSLSDLVVEMGNGFSIVDRFVLTGVSTNSLSIGGAGMDSVTVYYDTPVNSGFDAAQALLIYSTIDDTTVADFGSITDNQDGTIDVSVIGNGNGNTFINFNDGFNVYTVDVSVELDPEPEPEPAPEMCQDCAGSGIIPCIACGGTGIENEGTEDERPCETCGGSGSQTCETCGGDGMLDPDPAI